MIADLIRHIRKARELRLEQQSRTKLAMIHKHCGKVAMYVSPELVDNPTRKLMATEVEDFMRQPVKAGRPIFCQCGAVVQFHPAYLDFERHANEYLSERLATVVGAMTR